MSAKKRVLVLGSGKRVQQAVLPALARATELYELDGVLARTPKELEVEGRTYAIEALADVPRERVAAADLVIACVAKASVPAVLETLARADLKSTDLLLDTPVLLFKHLGHLGRLASFRNVWVAEDCTTLPAFDVVRAFLASGAIGELREIVWWRAAYAYHGIAMAKALFGDAFVTRATRRKWQAPYAERIIHFPSGTLRSFEPRDYATGRWTFLGTRGVLADYAAKDHHVLETLREGERAVGFRIGGVETHLDEHESDLMGPPLARPEAAGVAVWMEGMKRVGLLRLLRSIAAGRGAYPLERAVDDTVADYHLEKFGRYVANPLTSPRFRTSRLAFAALTKLARS